MADIWDCQWNCAWARRWETYRGDVEAEETTADDGDGGDEVDVADRHGG